MKIEGSGSESGCICQRHVSADPDPHQNVSDLYQICVESINQLNHNFSKVGSGMFSPDPDPYPDSLVRGVDLGIRIHTKKPWIQKTDRNFECCCHTIITSLSRSACVWGVCNSCTCHSRWLGRIFMCRKKKNTEKTLGPYVKYHVVATNK
jgi:hypothetical protein